MADHIDDPRQGPGSEPEPVLRVSKSEPTVQGGHTREVLGPVERSLPSVMLPGAVALAVLAGISVFVGRMDAASKPAPAAVPAGSPAPLAETPAVPAPIDLLATEVKEIKSQFDGLVSQLKGIEGKYDSLTKPAPPPDLTPIQGKLDDLAKSVSALLPLAEKVSKLETHAGGVEATVTRLGDRLAGLSGTVQRLSEARPATVRESPRPASTPVAGAASLAEGVALFQGGKLQDAGDFFKKLESSSPNDARVYYYEAFINAMTTNDWQGGETLRLASKGASLERTGATKPADIDSAFADLPANLKSWLTFFRNQGK
jgi:hypothetical protein